MGTNLGYCLYLIGHVMRRIETAFLRVKEQANERKSEIEIWRQLMLQLSGW